MVITKEELNPCTVKLHVVCDPQEVSDGFKKALKKLAKNVRIAGFRPGAAPTAMVEGMINPEDLHNEAAETLLRTTLKKAIDDQELKPDPTTAPIVSLKEMSKDENKFAYEAKIPLPPQVELGEYKGLPLEKPKLDVTDDEVTFQVDEFRKRKSTRETVTDRGVQEGDIVVFDLQVDGKGDGRSLMVVAGQTFPTLDEALKGMRLEEVKAVDLEFPESFGEKDLAGTSGHAQITLTSLSAPVLPTLDDEFAQSLQTENVDDLRTKIREGIVEAKESMIKDVLVAKLLDALLEKSTVHVSDPMWENLASRRLQEVAQEQAQQGKSLDDYAKENGMTGEQYVDAWYQRAEHEVRRALLIQQIYTKEGIELTNDDLNAELFNMAREFQTDPQTMLGMLQQNNAVQELHFRAISRRVGDVLLEHADVTEVELSEMTKEEDAKSETTETDAPKAKKPRAKKAAADASEAPEEGSGSGPDSDKTEDSGDAI